MPRVQPRGILAKDKGEVGLLEAWRHGDLLPHILSQETPKASLQQNLPEAQGCEATGYKAQNTQSEPKAENKYPGCGPWQ